MPQTTFSNLLQLRHLFAIFVSLLSVDDSLILSRELFRTNISLLSSNMFSGLTHLSFMYILCTIYLMQFDHSFSDLSENQLTVLPESIFYSNVALQHVFAALSQSINA